MESTKREEKTVAGNFPNLLKTLIYYSRDLRNIMKNKVKEIPI
jgi:hypothetical protein